MPLISDPFMSVVNRIVHTKGGWWKCIIFLRILVQYNSIPRVRLRHLNLNLKHLVNQPKKKAECFFFSFRLDYLFNILIKRIFWWLERLHCNYAVICLHVSVKITFIWRWLMNSYQFGDSLWMHLARASVNDVILQLRCRS